jgi:hypothetical protein
MMHFYALFVVTTTTYGEHRVVYGGMYRVMESVASDIFTRHGFGSAP